MRQRYLVGCIGAFAFAMLVFFWKRFNPTLLRIFGNRKLLVYDQGKQRKASSKRIRLYYWQDEKCIAQKETIVWNDDAADNLSRLVNAWLSLLYEDRIIKHKITLTHVLAVASSQEVYLSFNQHFLPDDWSIYQKWQLLECLVKTIRSASLSIQLLHFLVKHQPMKDAHLDFSLGWPITGFASV